MKKKMIKSLSSHICFVNIIFCKRKKLKQTEATVKRAKYVYEDIVDAIILMIKKKNE